MTYGWMLLVVALVGGAVFSFMQSQGIESASGFNTQDFNIRDFGITDEESLSMEIKDPLGESRIDRITVSDGSSNVSYIVRKDLSEEQIVNLPGIETASGTNNLNVNIIYSSGELKNLSEEGQVTGSLRIKDDFEGWNILEYHNFESGGLEEWRANGPIEIRKGWLAQTCGSSTTTEMNTNIYDGSFNYSEIRVVADAAPLDSWDNEFMRMEVNTGSGWQQIGNEYTAGYQNPESFPELDCVSYKWPSDKLYEFNGTIQTSDLDSLRFVHGANQDN
jgi:hypothetical protein